MGWGEQLAKLVGALVSAAWAGMAFYVVWLLRASIVQAVTRLSGFEGWGLKFSLSGGQQAMTAAVEMAAKNAKWQTQGSPAERQRALDRAATNRSLFEGAEILWVDDRPSNNRNEARMLRSFGALITFACTSTEAREALNQAAAQHAPFDVILSDIARDLPLPARDAGLAMLHDFVAAGIRLPVIFYVGSHDRARGTPADAFAITDRPDELLNYVTDALARVRRTVPR